MSDFPCCDPPSELTRRPCIGNDPTCPCQDGDICHYVDDPVTGTKGWLVTSELTRRARQLADNHVSDGYTDDEECVGCRADCMHCEGTHRWPCEVSELVPALLDRLTAAETKIRELEESRGIERVVHAIQEQQLREHYDKAPRWDEDRIVIENGWLSGRCARCGEALPAALVDPVDPEQT